MNNLFWKGYYLFKNPNKIYQKGRDDVLNNLPRYQYKIAIIFSELKKTQEIYNAGYDDGLKEKLIKKI